MATFSKVFIGILGKTLLGANGIEDSSIKIKIVTVGHMPAEFDSKKLTSWKSKLFTVVGDVENFSLTEDSDGENWEFTDSSLEIVLPKKHDGDFLVVILNVPIQHNYYARRLSDNRVAITFHEMKNILMWDNIPLENLILRLLYSGSLLFTRSGQRIPLNSEFTNYTHDETRGCLFDMNGIKTDIIHSCADPIICSDCCERMRKEQVSNSMLSLAQEEIKRIKKPLFYRMAAFVKSHPLWSIAISAVSAIVLGAIGSYLATVIYEASK
ncbi:hypothetical protein [Pseudoalteromonas sp. Ld20]|uniref:hypothetical protein n=1 Tax=Pseudoalteromonas sp. Ld20 TaxID=649165 RepID=UPI003865CB29